MRFFIPFLFAFRLAAQPLPPGTYSQLKAERPLVLDTGSYTFVGLEMKDLGPGIWLDGRKAKKLVLQSCRFDGKTEQGQAVFGTGDLEIHNCRFSRLGVALVHSGPAGELSKVSIRQNTFTDNLTAVSLQRQGSSGTSTLDFTLKCNQFKLSCADGPGATATACDNEPFRKGLVIGEGVRVHAADAAIVGANQIGGMSHFSTAGLQYPNANLWPVRAETDRSEFPLGTIDVQSQSWCKAANWVAIENNPTNPEVLYFRYQNEFVQNAEEEGRWNISTTPVAFRAIMTGITINLPGELACENFDVFPLRVAVLTDSAHLLTRTQNLNMATAWMGDAFPNPSEGESRIKAFIPSEEPFAVLQIVELGTGRILSGKVLEERGQLELILDCSKAASGTYGYQLLLGKKALGQKKLTIIK